MVCDIRGNAQLGLPVEAVASVIKHEQPPVVDMHNRASGLQRVLSAGHVSKCKDVVFHGFETGIYEQSANGYNYATWTLRWSVVGERRSDDQ